MADPANTTTTDSGNDNGANIAQVLAQVAAGMAGLTTTLNEITAKLNSVSENLKKSSTNDDTNFEISSTGVSDPFDEVRRNYAQRDQIFTIGLQALSKMVENGDALMKRSLDHFGSLPPINKPATGC